MIYTLLSGTPTEPENTHPPEHPRPSRDLGERPTQPEELAGTWDNGHSYQKTLVYQRIHFSQAQYLHQIWAIADIPPGFNRGRAGGNEKPRPWAGF
jgi:hypothetical protein